MSAELKTAAETEPALTATSEPIDTAGKKTDGDTDPDPYCCVPKDPGGPDT
jgi:hypothetical protein